jgi:twitching motility protein PilT
MAGVDSLLRMLANAGGDELRLGTDEPPRMLQGQSPLRLSIPPTADGMLRHLLAGVLTAEHEAELARAGRVEGSYVADSGQRFAVSFARSAAGITAVFRRQTSASTSAAPPAPAPSAVVSSAPSTTPSEPSPRLLLLLQQAIDRGASDLHLCSGERPTLRIDGKLTLCGGELPVDVAELFAAELSGEAGAALADGRSADLSFAPPSLGRFRVNLYRTDERLAAAVRVLMRAAPSLSQLHLPLPLDDLAQLPHGLVVVCGPTGAGKSATLAALAAEAARARGGVVLTLEDPVEYAIAAPPPALVRQRQVGRDVRDFPTGLRDALREDPDVLLIGEMRDPETISLALTAAETGHLVLTSLHSRSTASAIERIVDAYAPERQQQIRVQLADALRAIVAQRLVPRASGGGRVAAVEVLRGNHNVASLIREGKTAQLVSVLQSSRKEGMLPLERCLADLVRSGQISRADASAVANDPAQLAGYLAT